MPDFLALPEDASRQYIDSVAIFTALEEAQAVAAGVRGGMLWKTQNGAEYLVRTSPGGTQKSLGLRSEENEKIFAAFHARKADAVDRLGALQRRLETAQRLNKALRVGRAPDIVVRVLGAIERANLADHFLVIGTHALYAYEAEAGVRILSSEAMATQDVDLLRDTRKRVQFIARLALSGSSMIGLLQKVDKTFRIRASRRYTAVNSDGFEVDIIRREAGNEDPHPLRISDDDDDFWVTQAKRAGVLLSGAQFSCVVVSSTGRMARMNTVAPHVFVDFKRWMSEQADRDPKKRPRDALQAQIVDRMMSTYLPHLLKPEPSRTTDSPDGLR